MFMVGDSIYCTLLALLLLLLLLLVVVCKAKQCNVCRAMPS
jgi:hypothetical protein